MLVVGTIILLLRLTEEAVTTVILKGKNGPEFLHAFVQLQIPQIRFKKLSRFVWINFGNGQICKCLYRFIFTITPKIHEMLSMPKIPCRERMSVRPEYYLGQSI